MKFIGDHISKCPPESAKPIEKTYYRLVFSDPLIIDDFKSRAQLCIEKKGYAGIDINNCAEHAVSLCPTKFNAQNLKDKYPKKYNSSKIAKLEIKKEHGQIEQNSINHANWWHPREFNPITISTIIGDE